MAQVRLPRGLRMQERLLRLPRPGWSVFHSLTSDRWIRADEDELDCYVSPIGGEISPAHLFWSPRKRDRRERLTTAGELRQRHG
jgi:hypothetical protein